MKKTYYSDFLKQATQLYGDKYDYSKVKYVNSSTKICVVCPEHGEFWTIPNNFLKGHKCPACSGRQRITKEVFISRSTIIHKGRYNYSKINWINTSTKVCIICSIHGDFWQIPKYHLLGNGCQKCFATPKSNTEEFIKKAKAIYGDKYDYSKVEYKGNKEKVCIICPIHGEWWMSPNNHLRGHRCPGCYGTPKYTTEEFIEKAKKVHGNKYNYSKVKYDGNKNKVCITCPIHGDFWQVAATHMEGSGCPKCVSKSKLTLNDFVIRSYKTHTIKYDYSKIKPIKQKKKSRKIIKKTTKKRNTYKSKRKKIIKTIELFFKKITVSTHKKINKSIRLFFKKITIPKQTKTQINKKPATKISPEVFIERSKEKHKIKYDYSKTYYVGRQEKVCIICPIHGEFWQNPHFHLQGGNCPKCVGGVRLSTSEFIEKARKVHGNRYDYSKVDYKNTATKVCIICREHGEFWQTPNNHLFGAGCPTCPQSNLEGEIRQFLIKNNIKFIQEKTFNWLVFNRKMFLDFYLPEYNVAIECQGGQHFSPTELFGGKDFYELTIERDKVKKDLCEEHGINILYYSNAHIEYPYPVFESVRLLLKAIKQNGIVNSDEWIEQPSLAFDDL
ncbi:MAG: hypothetical protein J6T20_01920 [Treponema sp.]|nr:hypothetical protein [Treponema sp.]